MITEKRTFARVARDTDVWPLHFRLGMWAWLLQRITGLGLVVYIFMHLFVISSAVWKPEGGSFDRLLTSLQSPTFIALDLLLLAAVVFHAMNGFRILLLDVGVGIRWHKSLLVAVVIVAAGLLLWGVVESVPYVLGKPLAEPGMH